MGHVITIQPRGTAGGFRHIYRHRADNAPLMHGHEAVRMLDSLPGHVAVLVRGQVTQVHVGKLLVAAMKQFGQRLDGIGILKPTYDDVIGRYCFAVSPGIHFNQPVVRIHISFSQSFVFGVVIEVGGIDKCREVNGEIAKYVDVMIGNEEDFTACLGFEVEGVDENLTDLDVGSFQKMIEKAVGEYPNFKATATTMRGVKTATVNDWGAMCWADGKFYMAAHRPNLEIIDRVGGGDSFASGFIYGLMNFGDPQQAVEYGVVDLIYLHLDYL